MAKKPLLDATSRPDSAFSAFTRGYRQSANIEDRRANQFRPSSTNPRGGGYGGTGASGGGSGRVRTSSDSSTSGGDEAFIGAADGNFQDRYRTQNTETPMSSTRKVDAEEAVRRTHFERN